MLRIAEPMLLGREMEYVADALKLKALSMGLYVKKFEALIAHSMLADYAVATTSGTTALHLALLALGVGPGDRVVIPACSYIATANVVRYCGGTPVFVDVHPELWTLDLHAAEETAQVCGAVGIITVHLYGVPCAVPKVPGVWVLEDACEAHGVPLSGDAAVLSFYANKIATCGEGGAVITRREGLAATCRLLRGQGTTGKQRYIHEELGYNYRLTDLQAALGCGQMEQLETSLERRALLRSWYEKALPENMERQARAAGAVDWVMPVLLDDRDRVAAVLAAAGIETRPVFPPLHKQPAYSLWADQNLPVSEALAKRGLLLPLHLGMGKEDVLRICDTLAGAI
jgi:perosamine synthetase